MKEELCAVCNIPAHLRCSGCQTVAYCGKVHQKEDWAKHREICRMCKVKTSENGHRYLVAAKGIEKGSHILREAPIILGPYPFPIRSPQDARESKSCIGCLRSLSAKHSSCPRCLWPACTKKCPGLTDPAFHAGECLLLAPLKSKMGYHSLEAILPLRCLVLQKTDPKLWTRIKEMAENADKAVPRVTNDKGEGCIFLEEVIIKSLSEKAPHLLPPDCGPETVRKIFSLLRSNIFKTNYEGGGHFAGVFPMAGVIEHSCMPNSRFAFEASQPVNDYYRLLKQCRIRLFAQTNISKGEHVTISFIDTFMATFSRQMHLKSLKNTRCFCPRCLDPRELGTDFGTQKCSSCSGWVVPTDPLLIHMCSWKCLSCGKSISSDEAHMKYYSNMDDDLLRLRNSDNYPLQDLQPVLAKYENSFHPNHTNCLDAKLMMIEILMSRPRDIARLSDAELDKHAGICRDVLNLLLLPCLLIQADHRISNCLRALSNLNLEILKRKVATQAVDLTRAKFVEKHCSELKSIAERVLVSGCHAGELESLRGNNVRVAPFC